MPEPFDQNKFADELTHEIVESYRADPRTSHLDAMFLPNRDRVIEAIELLRRLVFPGFFEKNRLSSKNISTFTGELTRQVYDLLFEQIHQTLRYELNRTEGNGKGDDCTHCEAKAQQVTAQFLRTLPSLRHMISLDVQAGFDGDPAAISTDETIFCYPGLDAIFTYRIAHELYKLNLPLLARIMSEYAHNETGIDIHPGARIDQSFFIDHGTGVVIGETTDIGKHVKVYQGVTLGALSTKEVEYLRGRKRHPTLEDDVTIYPNATILGGETVIGQGATIGGSVFLTRSIPAGHRVTIKQPDLNISPPKSQRKKKNASKSDDITFDI